MKSSPKRLRVSISLEITEGSAKKTLQLVGIPINRLNRVESDRIPQIISEMEKEDYHPIEWAKIQEVFPYLADKSDFGPEENRQNFLGFSWYSCSPSTEFLLFYKKSE